MDLRAWRHASGMTQCEVANALEVDQSAVSNWEKRKSRPLRKYQAKLAELYGCSIDELMGKQLRKEGAVDTETNGAAGVDNPT